MTRFFVLDMANAENPRGMSIMHHPGIQHSNGAGLSFADGHAGLKRWWDDRFLTQIPPAIFPRRAVETCNG